MNEELDRKLFKAVVAAIMENDPSAEDLNALATKEKALRLAEAIQNFATTYASLSPAKVVILHSGTSQPKSKEPKGSKGPKEPTQAKAGRSVKDLSSADEVFDLLKRRKLTRDLLRKMLEQLDPDFFSFVTEEESMRDWLKAFRALAHPDDWKLLVSMISGEASIDPYLRDILS